MKHESALRRTRRELQRTAIAGVKRKNAISGPPRLIYRISDGSSRKNRFPFATKRACLENFLSVFAGHGERLLIIADNVSEATFEYVTKLHGGVVRTSLGSGAQSWRHAAFEIALAKWDPAESVYFVEDDYLHGPLSPAALVEGLEVADYVTLYDLSDKYMNGSDGGPNPFVENGGELTRVLRTKSAHWKLTNSTTMTFATTVRTLREDYDIWDRHTRDRRYPDDLGVFLDLMRKGRTLISPIPGCATHCEIEWAAPGVDWEQVLLDSLNANTEVLA